VTIRRFRLPRPPSSNNLYFNHSAGGRRPTKHHERWRREAMQLVMTQRKGGLPAIAGRYRLDIICERQGGADLDNKIKAVSDLLVLMNVIVDDCLCEEIHVCWGDITGCEVTVEEICAIA
jgi:Holliday junction resolvase RusA-like endonuclease